MTVGELKAKLSEYRDDAALSLRRAAAPVVKDLTKLVLVAKDSELDPIFQAYVDIHER